MVVPVDVLQRVGLNKYEAEAYVALLTDGPLTGYELGKRSNVPLSKSYEVLERLSRRGLALVQPGDPPHYSAEAPERFLERTRAEQESLLAALTETLAGLERADRSDDFWVIRGRSNVLARARAVIDEAGHEVVVAWSSPDGGIEEALDRARGRGCRSVARRMDGLAGSPPQPELLGLVVDGREALVGTLTPAAHCQAVVTGNPALVAACRDAWRERSPGPVQLTTAATAGPEAGAEWLAWENRKHERLRRLASGGRVA
jgi:hypothetical protein